MAARYAIYWAPPEGSALAGFGDAWLGREGPLPSVPPLSADEITAATAEPATYGLHATLKPPFRLASGRTEEGLFESAAQFAAQQSPFDALGLVLKQLGGFLALTPVRSSPDLDAFAGACVRHFDPFRAAPPADELQRRRARGLSERQEELLLRWGYPYVMEEFRFHVTLTGSLPSQHLNRIRDALLPVLMPIVPPSLAMNEICVFKQPESGASFHIAHRYELSAPLR